MKRAEIQQPVRCAATSVEPGLSAHDAARKDGLPKIDFKAAPGKVSYHIPCHGRVQKIGKPVFKAMAKDAPDCISSDFALAGHHIAQGMAHNQWPAARLQHPLSLVRLAYGLE